ncbi:MAG: hypothetical protein VX228_00285 [Pseudomonadota bacterium]|nr:hypothetical protein [Pseudomonadota bacterium]
MLLLASLLSIMAGAAAFVAIDSSDASEEDDSVPNPPETDPLTEPADPPTHGPRTH